MTRAGPLGERRQRRRELGARAGRAGDRDEVQPAVGVRSGELRAARRSTSARRAGRAAARAARRRAGRRRSATSRLRRARRSRSAPSRTRRDRRVRHRDQRHVDPRARLREAPRGSAPCACPRRALARPRAGSPARRRAGRRTGSRARRCLRPPRPPPPRAPACPASPSGRRRASSSREHLGEVLVAAAGQADDDELVAAVERAGERVRRLERGHDAFGLAAGGGTPRAPRRRCTGRTPRGRCRAAARAPGRRRGSRARRRSSARP